MPSSYTKSAKMSVGITILTVFLLTLLLVYFGLYEWLLIVGMVFVIVKEVLTSLIEKILKTK